MNAILLVLRTGMQWNALAATGICSSSSAHRRFSEWTEAGVFERLWREELSAYDARHAEDSYLEGRAGRVQDAQEVRGANAR